MDVRLFFGALTLAPAVAALLLVALGLWGRPIRRFAFALGVVGAAIPILCLVYFATDLFSGAPLRLALFGLSARDWYSPAYRVDSLSVYAAFGVAVIVAPLLLWMAWRGEARSADAAEVAGAGDDEAIADAPEDTDGAQSPGLPAERARGDWTQEFEPAERWVGLALALGLESAALTLCFADNLLLLGVAWLLLAVFAWGLGEIGSATDELDRLSLALMLAGPVLTVATFLFVAVPAGTFRLSDLQGGGASLWVALLTSVTLALAAGAYPFLGWVRRRAVVTPAAGFAAVALGALPAALFVGARAYAALQDANGFWPQIGAATPPITIGIVAILLGAITVAICGLLALGRRDGRALVALLAIAQVGWGLMAFGVGRPLSIVALVLLLGTSVFGLGAMIASLFAGGMLTGDLEPAGAGPRPFGAPLRPLNLFAWALGAVTLVGAPPFAGFAVRHLLSVGSLGAAQLSIPLVGLAWVGDALLALAVLRATAPAFATEAYDIEKAMEVGEAPAATPIEPVEPTGADERQSPDIADDAEAEAAEAAAPATSARPSRRARLSGIDPSELPGFALALVALICGVAPGLQLWLGARAAAESILPANLLGTTLQTTALGYTAAGNQWLPGLAWIILLVGGVLAALVSRRTPRVAHPVYLAGQAEGETAIEPSSGGAVEESAGAVAGAPEGAAMEGAETEDGEEAAEEIPVEPAPLAEPGDAWKELGRAFRSPWATPGVEWLLRGLEADEADEGEDDRGADEAEADEADEAAEPGAASGADDGQRADPAGDAPPAVRATDEPGRRRAAEGTGDQA